MEDKQEETMKDRIVGLLQKGYKRGQLINDLGFADAPWTPPIRAHKELVNDGTGASQADGGPIADDQAPEAKSEHGGKGAAGGGRDVVPVRKDKESVLPEWLKNDVAGIFDGQTRDQRIFLAGMSVPLMGLRLFAEGVKPMIELLATWQEGQAQAARAAQGSGLEMAREAGETAASGVAKYLADTKPWLSAAPDPMKAMMADGMRPAFQQMMGQLMGVR